MDQLSVTVASEESSHNSYYPSAESAPVECNDGSLVIDPEGRIVPATPEQQAWALRARQHRAAAQRLAAAT